MTSKLKYIDLKFNGRLFPLWIMKNFRTFVLPKITLGDNEDPCSNKGKEELRKYQVFLSKYLDYNSPHRNILIYHGLGSGKTATTVNIYNMLYNYTPGWNVFILIKAALKNTVWGFNPGSELDKWLIDEDKEFRKKNITFISYDSPIADKTFIEVVKNADISKKNLFIIDEAHNFIRNVYSNFTTKKGKRAQIIYDHIIQDKKDNESSRVILISGTPAINDPYELALLFNLLRADIFPKSKSEFYQRYVSISNYPSINPATKNNFQRRIIGLVSYYIGATPDLYATKTTNYVNVPMSKYHDDIYSYFEGIENNIAKKYIGKSKKNESYRTYTRQASNFVFPFIAQGKTGETRPRPAKFKLTENDAQNIDKGKKIDDSKAALAERYLAAINDFVNSFRNYLQEKASEDLANNTPLVKDVELYITKYERNYDKFIDSNDRKSSLLSAMHTCSSKMLLIILNMMNSPGPILLYSNYVFMEGLQIFKIYLEFFGYNKYNSINTGLSYMEFHGGIDVTERFHNLSVFNSINNIKGEIIKLILISPAGAEGITLRNVRQVHLMEPYWNETRMEQMIGRAVRQCSHSDLPVKNRNVIVFRYRSVHKDHVDKWTTDQYIEDMARSKEGLIQSFLESIREVAIDCELFKNHNMIVSEYKCFQFEEQSYFDNQIGPAYKMDIYEDMKMDNGSNSLNSITKRVKVIKIKAVIIIDETNKKYSETETYWYNPETSIVYDVDLHFPVGKLWNDENNIPIRREDGTFIINKIIDIP